MNARDRRLLRRAEAFYEWFVDNPDEPITLPNLCMELGCAPGHLSRAAIQIVRRWAEAEEWQFPPAVPANGHTYVLTHDPARLIDPALHTGAVKLGLARRENHLLDFIHEHKSDVPPQDQAVANTMVLLHKREQALREVEDEFRQAVVAELIKGRREDRLA